MRILITGGAGYIGTTLTPMLLQKGHSVTVIDNLLYGQTPFLDLCGNKNFTFVRGDARDERTVKELVAKHDALLPLACLVGAPLCAKDPIAAQTVNFDAVKLLSDTKSKDQILIFPCTNSGYGVGQDGIFCTEDSSLNPVSLYGRLKVDIEKHLLDTGECFTFRFATVFGASPRMRLDLLVNDFTYRAVYDRFVVLFEPHFKRNYLHVKDAAGAFIHGIENYDKMKGRPYNVGLSDANLSKYELCQVIQRQIPDFRFLVSDVGEDIDKRNYIVSNERIEKTGFRTTVNLDEGIAELVKAFQIIKRSEYANI